MSDVLRPKRELILPPGVKRPEPPGPPHLKSEMLLPVPREYWPKENKSEGMWMSMYYSVVQWPHVSGFVPLSVRTLDHGQPEYAEMSWDDLMRVKREVGHADRQAIEVYPKDRDNLGAEYTRYLWLCPTTGKDPLPFVWRSEKPRAGERR